MKALLLQPNYDTHVVSPALGLGYLASTLEQEGHQVHLYDGTLHKASTADFLREIQRYGPDLIGITVFARGHHMVKALVAEIKKSWEAPIVIGGPQVSGYPADVLADIRADYAVFGEGERTIVELARYLATSEGDLAEIDGLAHFGDEGVVKLNRPRELIANLDEIPFPAWHLMPPKDYRIVPILAPAKGFPTAPIMTTRGCPYWCTFCATNVTWRRKLRYRSTANILAEIELLVKEHGVKEILISDDNFTAKRVHAEQVCEEIIRRKLPISWQLPNGTRIDDLDLPLLEKMKRSGCHSIGLGIESGNQQVLKNVRKQLDLSLVKQVLQDMKRAGIRSYGFFIFGLPGETRETAQDTIDFAVNNPFDRAWFNILAPYPGSPLFEDWRKDRPFNQIDWYSHDANTAIVLDKISLPYQELEAYQKKAAWKFYLRPHILWDLLTHLGPREIKTIFMTRFMRKYLHLPERRQDKPSPTPSAS